MNITGKRVPNAGGSKGRRAQYASAKHERSLLEGATASDLLHVSQPCGAP